MWEIYIYRKGYGDDSNTPGLESIVHDLTRGEVVHTITLLLKEKDNMNVRFDIRDMHEWNDWW